ncbi:hypothetical protein PybrP1_009832 [[Pythium] brassicae (nom. inval.)]|nr:hypothetical protein PybrP1_009832 [[Pythium] brassicae (nom. inval.)]
MLEARAPSGEAFVRVNATTICESGGLLHGAQPFVLRELLPNALENRNLRDRTEHYELRFRRLEQLHDQLVARSVMRLYALLESERAFIEQWATREDALCQEMLERTELLFQLNLFAAHLESETRGQVRMWRLPATDSQHQRCVKAARENVKRRFFSVGSTGAGEQLLPAQPALEVLSVFKVENRALLHQFRCFTQAMAPSEVKIKGLFCTVPSESIEHCVVFGMHHDEQAFQRCLLPGDDIQLFNRASRYSTFEERCGASSGRQRQPIEYLALCRVAMGKTVRVKKTDAGSEGAQCFPIDPAVGALYVAEEEEYLVRYPQAVVPEFIVQCDMVTGAMQSSLVHAGGLLCGFDGSSSVFSRVEFATEPVDAAATETVSDTALSAESVLANCARQQKLIVEDVRSLQRAFWAASRDA